MRAISQLLVAIILIAIVVAATTLYAHMVSEMLLTYTPSDIMLVRVGIPDVNLKWTDGTYWWYQVAVKLMNLGSEEYQISDGYVVAMVNGTKNNAIIVKCNIDDSVTIRPGASGTVYATCILDSRDLIKLYGTPKPDADLVKNSFLFLYIKMTVQQPSHAGAGRFRHGTALLLT